MSFDSTACAIIFALVGVSIFLLIELTIQKSIKPIHNVIIALAFYGSFAGYELIKAALEGDPINLPEAWRIHLSIAGIVSIGLALQHIIKTFKKIIKKQDNY